MFVNKLTELFVGAFQKTTSGILSLVVDNSAGGISVPNEYTGNVSDTVVLTPTSGSKIVLKGITLEAEGVGNVRLTRGSDGSLILPIYGSNFARSSASGALNFELNVDETVNVTITDMNAGDLTFVGISYIELPG